MTTSLIEAKPKVCVVKGGAKLNVTEPTGEHLGAISVPIEAATNGVWVGVLNIPPQHISKPHHHGEQAVIVYIISGSFNLIVGEDKEVYPLRAGGMAVVPSGTVHSEE
jgi:uncharacterized RmlC-like cupin family protein